VALSGALASVLLPGVGLAGPREEVEFPPPRPTTNDVRLDNLVPIPMRDGVILYADVYRPMPEGRYPVLVARTPYSTELQTSHLVPLFFARRGYVYVNQDVRGRHESEGRWEPWRNDIEDGYDTIEWAARQPWSNGKVAMHGRSYGGYVQWLAAITTPPHLVTVVPTVASTSTYHDAVTLNGAFRLALSLGWGAVMQASRVAQNFRAHTMDAGPEGLSYEKVIWHLPLTGMPKLLGHAPKFYTDWIEHPDYSEYWKPLNVEEQFQKIDVPVLTIGGWFDLLLQGTVNGFVGMREQGKTATAREKSRMIIGPWEHPLASRRAGELDFGEQANVDYLPIQLRWYDYWLKDMDTGIQTEPPVALFVMGKNAWRYETEFPLARTQYRQLYFHSGGRANSDRGDGHLSWELPPPDSPPDRYTYDPVNPVPTVGGNNCCGVPTLAGPRDQRRIESRDDVLVYTSDFLDNEIEVTGPVKVVLFASSDAPDTDFVAKLVDVYPDGRAINVAEGVLRARYRDSLTHPEPLQPGKTYSLTIDLVATSNVFLPGHRIRVDVTSSHFPQFDRNPNTGDQFGITASVRVARQTVYHASGNPSHILLPVVP
jgi:putative CocE/NonD family hydrolase